MAAGRVGRKRAYALGGTVLEAAFGGSKYGILKFGRFWRIDVRIADSDIFTTS